MNWKKSFAAFCSLLFVVHSVSAQSTLIAYQGHLSTGGVPANGNFDFVFSLYNSSSNGVQQGQAVTNLCVPVINGQFTVSNDFGAGPWTGQQIWLQLFVRTNGGSDTFTPLLPRQAVMAMPYALQSLNAANAVSAASATTAAIAASANSVAATNVTGTILSSSLPLNPSFSGTVTAGSFSGNGGGLTGLPSISWPENIQSVPDLGYDSWNVFLGQWGNSNSPGFGVNSEIWLTNMIQIMGTNSVRYRWDHLWITDGTFNGRDANGKLAWNTNIFTRGMAFYTALAHSNGVKLLCYTSMNPVTCAGNPGLGYSQPNHIQQDLYQMMDLGFDGTMIDLCDNGVNFGNTNLLENFWRAVHDAILAYQTAVLATNGLVRPFQIQCSVEGNDLCHQQVTPSQYETCQDFGLNVAGDLDFPSALTNAHAVQNSWNQLIGRSKYPFPQSVYYPGQYPSWDTNTMNMYSMFLGEMRAACAYPWVGSPTSIYSCFASEFTPQIYFNTNILAIYLDPACIPATVVWSNSLDEIWMRPLGGVGLPHEAVLCVNANSSSQTIAVNVNALLLQSNTIYSLSDPYQNGAVLSNFQNSFTVTVSATNSRLFRVDLNTSANAQFGNAAVATNLSAGTLSVSNQLLFANTNSSLLSNNQVGMEIYNGDWYFQLTPGSYQYMFTDGSGNNDFLISPRFNQVMSWLPFYVQRNQPSVLTGTLTVLGTTTLSSNLIVSAGENITGGGTTNATTRGFVGNGANLTNLNASSLTGAIPSGALPAGIVTNTLLGLPVLNLPNSGARASLMFTLPAGTSTMSAIGDSITYGSLANPLTSGFAYLLAGYNNLTLNNYGANGHAVADYGCEVSNAIVAGAPFDTFQGGVNDEIIDSAPSSIPGFTMGMLGQLSLLEIGTNRIAGTNMTVISGIWSNTTACFDTCQNPSCGVLSATPGSALSNRVAGKTIIIGALDFNGSTNVGGCFSVTIDGATVATNYLTNTFASIFKLSYEPCAFYYPNYPEGFHSVVITNLGTGTCAIEYVTTVEMVPNPPLVEVFNVPPQTNYATGPGGGAASVDAHNKAIQYVCDLLDYAQFPVAQVDAYGTMMAALGTNMYNTNIYGDVVHPANYGHYLLAQAAQRQINKNNAPTYRAGRQAINSLSTSQTVAFSAPLPAYISSNYAVGLTFTSALASPVSAAAMSKTTNGFTIILSAGISAGATVDYTVWPYQ